MSGYSNLFMLEYVVYYILMYLVSVCCMFCSLKGDSKMIQKLSELVANFEQQVCGFLLFLLLNLILATPLFIYIYIYIYIFINKHFIFIVANIIVSTCSIVSFIFYLCTACLAPETGVFNENRNCGWSFS